jgi:hypothetical protein
MSAHKQGAVAVAGTMENGGKETTGTTKESDVTSRNLRKKGMVIHHYAIQDKQP